MHDIAQSQSQHTTTLDVRSELEQGGEPFDRIMAAAAETPAGGTLIIIAPFEPVPLYGVLGSHGFTHTTEKRSDAEWVVTFTRQG